MRVVITGSVAILHGPFPISFVGTISALSGKKVWQSSAMIKFEALPNNLKRLQNCGHDIEFQDNSGLLAELAEFERMPIQTAQVSAAKTDYRPKIKLRDYQNKAIDLSAERRSYALFLEMGLGKTAITITNIGMLTLANKLTGVLILSPKGVHKQWIEEQFPEHFDERIKYKAHVWTGTVPNLKRGSESLSILSMNIDAIRTKNGYKVAADFLKEHNGTNMIVIDESHAIKSGTSQRTKAAWELGKIATYRRIMTGTPISKNISDLWSQFKFLDDRILGHKYFTSFRNHYLIMGGYEGRQIVGQKNVEELYRAIAPHSYRLTKAEALDLPEKIYIRRRYEMNEVCATHYKSLKKNFLTMLESGEIIDVNNAVSCLLRLQQVLSGYLPSAEGETFEVFSDDRIQQMLEILNQTEGQAVIWARFTQDILRIVEVLNKEHGPKSAVAYYGGNVTERGESVKAFLSKEARFFVSNPAAGGTGLNLQGSGCQTVIFYNNDFNFITRAQAEDRTHRLGMKGAVTYFDLLADKSVDKHVLNNLRSKKSISSLTLDEIRSGIAE
jgi:SNF2 family DNA or RNA helicase